MTGQATAHALEPELDSGSVTVRTASGRLLQVMDARPKRFTPAEVEEALERQEKKAGAVVAHVFDRTEQSWAEVRRELNAIVAGGASARVMILAHHSLRAHQALELTTLAAARAFGEEQELADKHMRNQAGLAVVATELLNKAYEAAREEAKATQGSATDQLMQRLGVTAQASAEATPAEGIRGHVIGAPLSTESPSKKEPK